MAAIKIIKIHPAIGIARLGNSPTGFFIGPEQPGVHPRPRGGYRDAKGSCRTLDLGLIVNRGSCELDRKRRSSGFD
jgi:hypothetical protein